MAEAINYTPPNSLVPFFTSEKFISLVCGPVGCVSCDTEFLTPTGWKRIDQYSEGDLVAQWNPETEQAEFVKPSEYIKLPCEEFYWFHHREGLSQKLSAEHRMVYQLRRKKPKLHEKTAAEIAEWHWRNGADMVRIPVTFKAPERKGMPYTDDEIRLGVAIAADGTITKSGAVTVNIKKPWKQDRLIALMVRCGVEWEVHKGPTEGFIRYYFYTELCDKVFGPQWWEANDHQLDVIADELPRWDGGVSKKGLTLYRAKPKASADFAQYVYATRRKKTSCILGGAGEDCYEVMASKRDAKFVGLAGRLRTGEQSNNCEIVPSEDGFKYCFSVPTSYLILRHNNCIFVTGNSTKTSASIMKIAYHAKKMAPCYDGIRRSRCCWVRNTRQQLADTSIKDFMKWFPDGIAGTFEKTNTQFKLKFDDVECEVLFRGLDDANDVRRLLSLQLSFAVFDEFREINRDIFETMQGRVGRYPDKMLVPPRPEWGVDSRGNPVGGCVTDEGKSNAHVWGASNPPDLESYWEELLSDPPDNVHVTIQPGGLSPEADWLEYLPEDYYENLTKGKSEDWIDVYVNSKFGKTLAGSPVFRAFSRDVHVAKEPLHYIRSSSFPLIVGMDVGLHPAAVIGQMTPTGRLVVLHSMSESGMGALRFVRERLKPVLSQRFPGQPAIVILDPAANTRSQTDERTVLEVLKEEGFQVRTAKTNALQPRISAVDSFLTRMIDGKGGIVFDEAYCHGIITALAGKYRYRLKKNGDAEDSPEKNHPWSDLADSLQYLCLHTDTSGVFGGHKNTKSRPVKQVNYRYV